MTTKGERAKQAMIESTIGLLNEKGYYGTSTNEILSRAGAPRGSMYYHFPGGKDEIVIASIEVAGRWIEDKLLEVCQEEQAAEETLSAIFELFRADLCDSNFTCGCPIAAVALECSGQDSPIALACAEVYQNWENVLLSFVQTLPHIPEQKTHELAKLIFILIEGAVLVARSKAQLLPLTLAEQTCLEWIRPAT